MLLGFDGFDHQDRAEDFVTRTGTMAYGGRTVISEGGGDRPFLGGRTGFGQSLRLQSDSRLAAVVTSASATLISGCGALGLTPGDNTGFAIGFYDYAASLPQCFVYFDGMSGAVIAYRNVGQFDETIIGHTDNNVFDVSTWQFCEVKATIHSTVGTITVHINGQEVLALTGLDTQNSTNASADGVDVFQFSTDRSALTAGAVAIDDFYVCDTTVGPGSFPCDDILGDLTVVTLNPTGNDSVQWTPVTGANWQEVGEIIFDGDNSYNYTITAGDEDRFTFAALLNTLTSVVAVQVTGAYRKDDATTHTLEQRLTSSSTTANGATLSLSTTWQYIADLFVQDPNGSIDWTATAVNLLRAGYKLTA